MRIWDGSSLPPGLRRRLETEIARHGVVHRQLLDLECERDARIREGQDRATEIARRLKTLRGIAEVGAETYAREFSWRDFKNRRQVGSLVGLTGTPHQSGDSLGNAALAEPATATSAASPSTWPGSGCVNSRKAS
jgi:transposase